MYFGFARKHSSWWMVVYVDKIAEHTVSSNTTQLLTYLVTCLDKLVPPPLLCAHAVLLTFCLFGHSQTGKIEVQFWETVQGGLLPAGVKPSGVSANPATGPKLVCLGAVEQLVG